MSRAVSSVHLLVLALLDLLEAAEARPLGAVVKVRPGMGKARSLDDAVDRGPAVRTGRELVVF